MAQSVSRHHSPRRHGFDPRPIRGIYGRQSDTGIGFPPFGFPTSVSFHRCYTLCLQCGYYSALFRKKHIGKQMNFRRIKITGSGYTFICFDLVESSVRRFQSQVTLHEFHRGRYATRTGVSLIFILFYPATDHSSIAPHPFISTL